VRSRSAMPELRYGVCAARRMRAASMYVAANRMAALPRRCCRQRCRAAEAAVVLQHAPARPQQAQWSPAAHARVAQGYHGRWRGRES